MQTAAQQTRYGGYSKTGQLRLEPAYPMIDGLDAKQVIVTLDNQKQQVFDIGQGVFVGPASGPIDVGP